MGLAVKRFFQTIPQLPFRFVTDFVKAGEEQSSLRFAVRSVKYNEAEGNTSDAAVYYGNGYYTIPLWDISSRSLSITFEETDNMKVTKFLDSIAEVSYNASPLMIAVIVREYDNMFLNPMKGRCYWCFLQDYDEPSFARTGGPSVVSITANFVVRAISENYAVDDDELNARISSIKNALNTQNYHDDAATGFWYEDLHGVASNLQENKTFRVDLATFDAGLESGDTTVYQGENLQSKAAKSRDKDGNAVASVWNAFRYNAQHKKGNGAKKLSNLMSNEDSWMSMAFKRELTVGQQKQILKEKYGLNDNDFKNADTLMTAMQAAEDRNRKNGGNEGEVWGSVYGCSGAVGWAALMTTQKEDYVMPQDMKTKSGQATGDFMTVVETEHPELFEKVTSSKFKTEAEAEAFITQNTKAGDIVGIGAKDAMGNAKGHRAVRRSNGGYMSDHAQGQNDAVPNSYKTDFTVSITRLKRT